MSHYFEDDDERGGPQVTGRSLLFACSNRSEYGLLRPLITCLNQSTSPENIASHTLMLFSDAIATCAGDADRDYSLESTQIRILEPSLQRHGESVGDHFARLASVFEAQTLLPYDGVVIAGDRYESFALASRCFFEKIPIFHLFGGDMSYGGHFDDHLRHAISHLACIHFPVNKTAKSNLINTKEEPSRIFHIGSPVVDEIAAVRRDKSRTHPWNVILSFNPMTLGPASGVANSLEMTLGALDVLSMTTAIKCLATRPNSEPGSQEINGLLDAYSSRGWLEVASSLGSPAYLYAVKSAWLVVGNSSSQLLEVPVLGTHSLLIGDRQKGRHLPNTVYSLPGIPSQDTIQEAIQRCLKSPRPAPCGDYGREGVTKAILEIVDRLMGLPRSTLVAKSTALALEDHPQPCHPEFSS